MSPDLALPRQGRAHAAALLALLGLFVLRVAAQLVQLIAPQAWLPAFEAWHSATWPYSVLVAAQIAIIAVTVWFAAGLMRGTIRPDRRVGMGLAVLGGAYFLGALARFVAGFTIGKDDPFLAAHVPGFFHLVLASKVLVAAHFHWVSARRAPA